jgi:hypothetical protein
MDRQQTDRAINKLIKEDGDRCSVCHTDFYDGQATYYGTTARGAPAVVGKCCTASIWLLSGFGWYIRKTRNN